MGEYGRRRVLVVRCHPELARLRHTYYFDSTAVLIVQQYDTWNCCGICLSPEPTSRGVVYLVPGAMHNSTRSITAAVYWLRSDTYLISVTLLAPVPEVQHCDHLVRCTLCCLWYDSTRVPMLCRTGQV